MLFTTSWDDGYTLDLRLADLLARHRVRGTFYVCPRVQHGQPMLSTEQIKTLSQGFEIGAHTIIHPRLTSLRPEEARREIMESKQWVEERTGAPCTMFCYPKGSWNTDVRTLVEEAGYRGARTTAMLRFSVDDAYAMPTSLHVYPFPLRARWTRLSHLFDPFPWLREFHAEMRTMRIPLSARTRWLPFAKAVFRYAVQTGQPHFHLWGHSEELERYGMWNQLDAFLSFVHAEEKELTHVPNSGLLRSS